MAGSRYIPGSTPQPNVRLFVEQQLLLRHYDFLHTQREGNKLIAWGQCQPSEHSIMYKYRMEFAPGKRPRVFPSKPQVRYHEDIHMYEDGSLCLYYPGDNSWRPGSHLYDTIVPWVHEWYVFYELYQIKGVWLHPAVSHTSQKTDN